MKSAIILFGIITMLNLSCQKKETVTNPPEDTFYSESDWVKIEPATFPGMRAYHNMGYDSESDRVILCGGVWGPPPDISLYRDTWAYDCNTSTWTKMNPQVSPGIRCAQAMAYDSESDRIILFGGGGSGSSCKSDTWAYDFNSDTWTKMEPPSSPYGRSGHRMVYDAESDRMIIFGGIAFENTLNDTWAYDYNTDRWTNMNPSVSPPARQYFAMAYDSESDIVILHGGGCPNGSEYTTLYGDTWAYDFNSNTWREVSSSPCPWPRVYHDIVYDAQWDRIVLFGGGTQSFTEEDPSPGYGSQTWLYNYNANSWVKIIPDNSPSNRKKHKMAYDIESDRVILFGGDRWDNQGNTTSYHSQTWVLEK